MNGNWPKGSTNPNCSPCVKWPQDYYDGRWSFGFADTYFFRADASAATKEWSGQQYRSPIFYQTNPGCGSGQVCVTAADLGTQYCGTATATYSGSTLTAGVVKLNTQFPYADGKAPAGACDARAAFHHEFGHVFSEGHSAIRTDLMYYAGTSQEHVDADSQAELRAVYGAVNSGSQGCPCLSIEIVKEKLMQEADALEGASAAGLYFPVVA